MTTESLRIEQFEQSFTRTIASMGRMWAAAWETLNHALLSTAQMLSVWVVDGVGAWLAAANLITVLGFSTALALLIGVALEVTGVVVIDAALATRRYNQEHPNDPLAMEGLAWGVTIAQFIVTGAMICLNTIWIDARLYSFIAIALLTTLSTIGHMLRDDVRARSHSAAVLPSPDRIEQVIADIAPATAKDRVMWAYRENPHADKREVAAALGIGYSTVSKAYRELLAEGAIEHNGDGGR